MCSGGRCQAPASFRKASCSSLAPPRLSKQETQPWGRSPVIGLLKNSTGLPAKIPPGEKPNLPGGSRFAGIEPRLAD